MHCHQINNTILLIMPVKFFFCDLTFSFCPVAHKLLKEKKQRTNKETDKLIRVKKFD